MLATYSQMSDKRLPLTLAIIGFLFLALVTEDFQEIPGRSEDSDDDT